jgi:hypothetical protein
MATSPCQDVVSRYSPSSLEDGGDQAQSRRVLEWIAVKQQEIGDLANRDGATLTGLAHEASALLGRGLQRRRGLHTTANHEFDLAGQSPVAH